MTVTHILLVSLLAMYRPPASHARCLEARHESIVERASSSADRYGVPVALLLTTAFLETHIGCDPLEGGGWGAPASRFHRNVAGDSDAAARALAFGFRDCLTWAGAVAHFRCGLCRCPHLIGYQPAYALHVAERIHARANVLLPERWREVRPRR